MPLPPRHKCINQYISLTHPDQTFGKARVNLVSIFDMSCIFAKFCLRHPKLTHVLMKKNWFRKSRNFDSLKKKENYEILQNNILCGNVRGSLTCPRTLLPLVPRETSHKEVPRDGQCWYWFTPLYERHVLNIFRIWKGEGVLWWAKILICISSVIDVVVEQKRYFIQNFKSLNYVSCSTFNILIAEWRKKWIIEELSVLSVLKIHTIIRKGTQNYLQNIVCWEM